MRRLEGDGRKMSRVLPWIAAAALLAPVIGCTGWSVEPLGLGGLNRVYVPFFKNDTFFRRVEHDLTRQVILRINERQDFFLTDENSAELILEGRIVDYNLREIAEDREDRVTSASSTITVEVKVIRAWDRKILRSEIVRDTAQYDLVLNETLESAREDSFKILSQRIVDLLEEKL